MKKNPDNHYSLLVEWSEEDDTWIGRCPELFLGGVHGDDRAKVYAELLEAVDEVLEIRKTDGTLPAPLAKKKFSGKFILRTTPEHHRLLTLRAMQERESLNNYVVKALQEPKQG